MLERRKRFEIRYNDRGYQVGDVLILREYTIENGYTGQSLSANIIYMTDFMQYPGYLVLGIEF